MKPDVPVYCQHLFLALGRVLPGSGPDQRMSLLCPLTPLRLSLKEHIHILLSQDLSRANNFNRKIGGIINEPLDTKALVELLAHGRQAGALPSVVGQLNMRNNVTSLQSTSNICRCRAGETHALFNFCKFVTQFNILGTAFISPDIRSRHKFV